MNTPLDNDLNRVCESFNQNHNHLRQTLMASLPDSIKQHKRAGRISHALAFIGDTIMTSRITKLAAAAVIIIAILTSIHFWGSPIEGIAWADVVRPILTARTVIFNVVMTEGENVPINRVMNMGTQRIRTEMLSADGKTVQVIGIFDYDTSLMLQLIPEKKTAVLIELKDIPEKPENVLEEMGVGFILRSHSSRLSKVFIGIPEFVPQSGFDVAAKIENPLSTFTRPSHPATT